MTPETTVIPLESDTVVEDGVIRHFVTANIVTVLDTNEQKIRDALVKLGWSRIPDTAHVVTITASRGCSKCDWELPAEFTGYSGPCPRCLLKTFGYTVLEAPAQKLRSKPVAGVAEPINIPLIPDKTYLVCDILRDMSRTDEQGWFRADVVYKVDRDIVTHLDMIRVVHVGEDDARRDHWNIVEEVPDCELPWYVRIPGLREYPKFYTEKSAEEFCNAMGRTFTTEYFTP